MKVFFGLTTLALAGCAGISSNTEAETAGAMGSAMFMEETGSYWLGGYGLPDDFVETLPPGTIDLSNVPESEWPI